MEHADDDIDILSGHDTLDGSISDTPGLLAQNFIIARSPGNRPDPAVQALQQAYADLKKRYNETVEKNQHMSRKLRDVGRLKSPEPEMATYGDHTDSFNSQGAAATAEHPVTEVDNLRAQQGYIRFLERERTTDQARVQQLMGLKNSYEESCKTMQNKLRDMVKDLQRKEEDLVRANESITDLKEENMRLKEDRDLFRKRAIELQDCVQTSMTQGDSLQQGRELEEVKVKCSQLEAMVGTLRTECDRLKVSEGIAQAELGTANKRIQELQQEVANMAAKSGQMDQDRRGRDSDLASVSSASSLPTVQELAHLKKVIADLKKTVVQQREFLSKLGKTNMATPRGSEMHLDTAGRLMLDDIGQSWENVPGEMWVGGAGGVQVTRDDQRPPAPCRPLAIDSQGAPSNSRNSPLSSPRRSNSDQARLTHEHSRSEVLLRRSSDTSHNSPRSKSEVLARTNNGNMLDSSRNQQTFNDLSTVNGSQYQGGSRRITPQAVVSEVFGNVVDNTPAFPVPVELRQSSSEHRAVSQHNGHSETSEKTCPVCSRDFSAMPIEDFQTHVFECFDDQENAPETLRAGEPTERICPMCNALFPEAVPQEEFEKHVQGHFEQEMIDRFEILNP